MGLGAGNRNIRSSIRSRPSGVGADAFQDREPMFRAALWWCCGKGGGWTLSELRPTMAPENYRRQSAWQLYSVDACALHNGARGPRPGPDHIPASACDARCCSAGSRPGTVQVIVRTPERSVSKRPAGLVPWGRCHQQQNASGAGWMGNACFRACSRSRIGQTSNEDVVTC